MTAFIKFDGVDGEAKEKNHKKWSNIIAFNQGMHLPEGESTGPARRRGGVFLDDIVVRKKLDKASPKIAEGVLKGKVFPKVEIHVTSSYADVGRMTYYAYELKNAMVTSYNISRGNKPKQLPVEELAMNFEEIKVTYTEVNKKGEIAGNVEYSWNVERGRE
jgi:type VI secretion system secreted protein Hcp